MTEVLLTVAKGAVVMGIIVTALGVALHLGLMLYDVVKSRRDGA